MGCLMQASGVDGGSMQDLLKTLSAGTQTLKRTNGRDFSTTEECTMLALPSKGSQSSGSSFRPRPSKEEVRAKMNREAARNFKNHSKNVGGEFRAEPRLKPKVLDSWTQARLVQPDRTIEKAPSGPRFRAQLEEFPATSDEMCTEMHQAWLKKHKILRDRQIHAEYHALTRIEKAKVACEETAQKKALARDLISRDHLDMPKMSAKNKAALAKVKMAVSCSRLFNRSVGIDKLEEGEAKCRAELEKARSASVLHARPRTPEHRPRHLEPWGGPDTVPRSFMEGKSWREKDDDRELSLRRMCGTH